MPQIELLGAATLEAGLMRLPLPESFLSELLDLPLLPLTDFGALLLDDDEDFEAPLLPEDELLLDEDLPLLEDPLLLDEARPPPPLLELPPPPARRSHVLFFAPASRPASLAEVASTARESAWVRWRGELSKGMYIDGLQINAGKKPAPSISTFFTYAARHKTAR